ncbi:MAG: beta strand repeat-containing protein, partial [Betaproteobacteria bacterium]
MNLNGQTLTLDTASGSTLTASAKLWNNSPLVKSGAGTAVLTASDSYQGTTTINAGTLQIGGAGSLASGAGNPYSASITNNGMLQYSSSANQTLSGVISGTGSMVKDTSTSTLTLSNMANTYAGGTTVSAGQLALSITAVGCDASSNTSNSLVGSGPFTVDSGAQVNITTTGAGYGAPFGCARTGPRASSFNISGTVTSNVNVGATVFTGPVTLNGAVIASTGSSVDTNTLQWGLYNLIGNVTVQGNSTISASYFSPSNRTFSVASGVVLTVSNGFYEGTQATGQGFTLDGGGTLVFTGGTSKYSGATTITAGTVSVGNGGAGGDIGSTSGVSVGNAGALSFNRSADYTFGRVISGAGKVSQDGSGTTTLTAVNTYSGTTSVNAGVLAIGVTNGLNKNSAVTVASGAKLTLGTNISLELSNGLSAEAGTLVLNGGTLTLSGGTNNIGAVTGSGTIVVGAGATVNLKAPLANTSVNIQMAGGLLSLTGLTHSLGTLTQTVSSSIDFAGGGKLTVANIGATFTGTLTATNWTSTTGNFYASAVNGGPARNTAALAPLNQIQLGTSGNAALTYWSTGTPGELRASSGGFTYWDKTAGNNQIDGGAGTWDGTLPNWANSTGSFNGTWAGGTSVATFGGTAGGIVTLGDNYSPSIGGLTFSTGGYTIARNVSTTGTLSLASNATV